MRRPREWPGPPPRPAAGRRAGATPGHAGRLASKRVSLTVGPVSYDPATAHDAAPSCQSNDDTAGTAARLDAHRYRLPRHGRHGTRPALRQPVLAGGTATALGRRARPDPRRGARRAAAAVQRETRHAGVVLHRPLERRARLRRPGAEARIARGDPLPRRRSRLPRPAARAG